MKASENAHDASSKGVDLEAQQVAIDDVDCWGSGGDGCADGTAGGALTVGAAVAGTSGDDQSGDPDVVKGQGVFASVWNTGVAFPSLVGTWCWPLVFAWILMIAWWVELF